MFTLKSNAFKNTFKNDHDLKRPKEDPKYNGSTKKKYCTGCCTQCGKNLSNGLITQIKIEYCFVEKHFN